MADTAERLLRLLSLLTARRGWRGEDLAGRLGVTPRTVRRDVERLRNLGYEVRAVPGPAGGYELGAGSALPPMLLDDDAAVAVAVGLRAAAGGAVAGMAEAAVRAAAIIERLLPDRLRRRADALQSAVVPLAAGDDRCVLTTGAYSLDAIIMHLAELDIPFVPLNRRSCATAARSCRNCWPPPLRQSPRAGTGETA